MSATVEIKQRECAACGHLCDRAGEFHPFMFCTLKRAGILDPWEELRRVNAHLGIDLPVKPPLVRNLSQFQARLTRDRGNA